MKIKGNRFVKIIGLAAFSGLIMSPLAANAQDQGGRPPESRRERPAMLGSEMNRNPIQKAHIRLQHLRKAAMHLNAAGCEEMANDVRRQIAQMETRLKNHSKSQPQGELMQRKDKEAKPDANAAIISEIRKLRQEMGELRNQVRRVQANATPRKESKSREDRPNAKERPNPKRPNAMPDRSNAKERPDQRPHAPLDRPHVPMPPPVPPVDRPQ